MNYSNPRLQANFDNWPYGNKRTKCTFHVEENRGRMRAVKTTTDPKTGLENKPKKTTYTTRVIFVDGDDDRLYIVQESLRSDFYMVTKSCLKANHETISAYDKPEESKKMLALFNKVFVR